MSPKLKPNEYVLIDVSTMYNPYLLATDEKCYFLNYYKFETAGNVRLRYILLQTVFYTYCTLKVIPAILLVM